MKKNVFLSSLTWAALLSPLLLTSCQALGEFFGEPPQGAPIIQRTGPTYGTASTATTSSKRGTSTTHKSVRRATNSVPVEAPSVRSMSSSSATSKTSSSTLSSTSSGTSSSNVPTPTNSGSNGTPAAPTMAPMAAPTVTPPTVGQ